ncbi:PREDICTED: protein AAR2 homolog [Polistes dominula]|uniref:Protein AAR2 homolog n=1 Tax=Polistes dominula TaxID=743375 RepID=A0ABM1IHZ2_POLDO|nr:PREDICTED: protein AAR2 homolog [Polistes dominula]XP_015179819.1 PREDICTED: protein AAR2 homolog [Polistes dominula]XP_015179829.1 PREDICTED: protein AAR2 homolog [Polistes dominula]XP_015179838.1 PREDICTED: protein AAR2 homolog [Polistes dominula]
MDSDDHPGEDHILIKNATLVVVDAPNNMEFGIDLNSWDIKTNKKYMGIKFIPPGFRFVHYRIEDCHGGPSFRIGFIHYFENGELMVKCWDKSTNEMSADPVDEDLLVYLRNSLLDLDKVLVPYCFDYIDRWERLTDKIDFDVVKRCKPLCGFIYSAMELVPCSSDAELSTSVLETEEKSGIPQTRPMQNRIPKLLPNLKPKPGSELRLTPIPDKYYPDNATPEQITRYNLDYSYTWEIVLAKIKCQPEILGELQLTFVCVLIGQNWEAFEQWKKILSLICGVDALIPSYRSLYLEFCWTIEAQLDYIPEDMLVDVIYTENFIYHHLRKLFRNIELHSGIDAPFKFIATRCRERICNMLKWNFGDLHEEDGEEAPIIVD